MPDYIYLLENRLSSDQQSALRQLREAAREAGMILFLTGAAVRDLHSGHAVRGLEVAVHGDALKLQKKLESVGAQLWGSCQATRTLYLCFPGTVRVDVVSTHRVEYPTPGKPVPHPASIQEDLRRRDFTANAMALSLNEGSFGLLMDPMNGVADIEAHTLRLVSNYGFIEEPSLMIRATRLKTRLGWELDPKSLTRYDNSKGDENIQYLSGQARSRELEQIGHEDEPLKVLQALWDEGWMQHLFPAWTVDKADPDKLEAMLALAADLLAQGVHADKSAAQMQLLTAKMSAKELAALKSFMLRPGFVEEWNNLDAMAAAFQKVLLAKENQIPSASYKLFTSYDPEAILWLGFTNKSAAVQERFTLFLKTWPEFRQRIPYALMQEMRITPELPDYVRILHELFLNLIDGKLTSTDEIKAFLEPYSPPAPPPTATVKRSRSKRAEAKIKQFDDDEEEEAAIDDDDLDDLGADDDLDLDDAEPALRIDDSDDDDSDDDDDDAPPAPPAKAKRAAKPAPAPKTAPPLPPPPGPAPVHKEIKPTAPPVAPPEPPKPEPKPAPAPAKKAGKPAPPPKVEPVKAVPAAKPAPKATAKPVPPPAKAPAKAPAKPAAKAVAKPALKPAPAKSSAKPPVKPVAKAVAKPAPKAVAAKPKPAAKPAPKPAAKPAPKPVAKPVAKSAPKPVAKKTAPASKAAPAKKTVPAKGAAKKK